MSAIRHDGNAKSRPKAEVGKVLSYIEIDATGVLTWDLRAKIVRLFDIWRGIDATVPIVTGSIIIAQP